MPVIDPSDIRAMHSSLTPKQRGILKNDRCLSNEVIDRFQIGVTRKFGAPRVAIPIAASNGDFVDVRCWLRPRRRATGSPKILHWERGYGGARLFPIDMLQRSEVVLVAGELDALAMISNGFNAITATAGESTWPDALSAQFADAGIEQVTVLPDHDAAGLQGADLRARSLIAHGLKVKMASWT